MKLSYDLAFPVVGSGALLLAAWFGYRYLKTQHQLDQIRSGQAKFDQALANLQQMTASLPPAPTHNWI